MWLSTGRSMQFSARDERAVLAVREFVWGPLKLDKKTAALVRLLLAMGRYLREQK